MLEFRFYCNDDDDEPYEIYEDNFPDAVSKDENGDRLKKDLGFKGLDILYDIVINWINNSYMLFRHYSIYYFIKEFEKYEL